MRTILHLGLEDENCLVSLDILSLAIFPLALFILGRKLVRMGEGSVSRPEASNSRCLGENEN